MINVVSGANKSVHSLLVIIRIARLIFIVSFQESILHLDAVRQASQLTLLRVALSLED